MHYERPILEGLSPPEGPTVGGVAIMLTGHNFGIFDVDEANRDDEVTTHVLQMQHPVKGTLDIPLENIQFLNHTALLFTLVEGSGKYDISLTVAGQESVETIRFSYAPPVITGISPDHGRARGGYPVTLTGINFGQSSVDNDDVGSGNVLFSAKVFIAGRSCVVIAQNNFEIQCITPHNIGANLTVGHYFCLFYFLSTTAFR